VIESERMSGDSLGLGALRVLFFSPLLRMRAYELLIQHLLPSSAECETGYKGV